MNIYVADERIIIRSLGCLLSRKFLANHFKDDAYLKSNSVGMRKLRKSEVINFKILGKSYGEQESLEDILDGKVGDKTEIISVDNWIEE